MSEMESRPIQGTALDADTPFFSPDGKWLAFHSNSENKFKKIAITGGASVTICDSAIPYGASWTQNNHILIGAGPGGILRVSADGGKPETIVEVKSGEIAHGPQLLPDGDTILFTLATDTTGLDRWDQARIVVHSLKSGDQKVLLEGGGDARYIETGHIVYALGTTLLAVRFDLPNLQVIGGPVPVIEGLRRSTGGTAAAQFSFSSNGSMVYMPGSPSDITTGRILALVDLTGARKPIPLPPGNYFHPRFSPDGKHLAVHTDDGKDIVVSIYDLAGTTSLRRLTFGGANRFPIWTPDGQRIVFQSDREGDLGLFWQRADGTGVAERLTKPEGTGSHVADYWLKDGKTLVFVTGPTGNAGISTISMERDSKAKTLIDEPSSSQVSAYLSPDGRWIVYQSNESQQGTGGRPGASARIYVQPFPPTGAKNQITATQGISPVWSPDGKKVFYVQNVAGRGDIMSIDVQTGPTFVFGNPTPLPIKNIIHNGAAGMPRGFDLSPDGKQFVVMLPATEIETN